MASRTGGRLTSLTTMEIFRVSVAFGAPLSCTITCTWFVLGPCASEGVQESSPVTGSMDIPEGASGPSSHLSVCAGISGSVAVKERLRGTPSFTLTWAAPETITGGEFTSDTVTVKVWVALKLGEPLSVATTLKVAMEPPSDSPVCQVIRPVVGEKNALAGPPGRRANEIDCAGTSASLTAGVKVKVAPSGTA